MLKNLNTHDFQESLGTSGTTSVRPNFQVGALYHDTDLDTLIQKKSTGWEIISESQRKKDEIYTTRLFNFQ